MENIEEEKKELTNDQKIEELKKLIQEADKKFEESDLYKKLIKK